MKVILNNNIEVEIEGMNIGSINFQGEARNFLELRFPITIVQTFEELNELFSDEINTKKLITEDGTQTTIYDNYSLKASVSRRQDSVQDLYFVMMVQKSYAEIQAETMQSDLIIQTELTRVGLAETNQLFTDFVDLCFSIIPEFQ